MAMVSGTAECGVSCTLQQLLAKSDPPRVHGAAPDRSRGTTEAVERFRPVSKWQSPSCGILKSEGWHRPLAWWSLCGLLRPAL